MKIIGKTGSGYIIQADEYEICTMMGFNSVYSDAYRQAVGRETLREGFEFSVKDLGEKVFSIRENDHRIKQAIETFRGMADGLEKVWPSFVKTATGESK